MRVAGLVQDSIVDGPGLRYVVFTQGCRICCDGCHNPDTWDYNGGTEISVEDLVKEMLSNPLTDGLTLSGGEPFDQAADCVSLAAVARENDLSVWVYTGKIYESLVEEAITKPAMSELLALTDVLIDGMFIAAERTLSKKWCGSKNQRILDVKKSLLAGKGVLLYDES